LTAKSIAKLNDFVSIDSMRENKKTTEDAAVAAGQPSFCYADYKR